MIEAGAIALGEALRRGEVSAEELARESLRRLEDAGRRHNALAAAMPERALGEARAANELLSEGRPAGDRPRRDAGAGPPGEARSIGDRSRREDGVGPFRVARAGVDRPRRDDGAGPFGVARSAGDPPGPLCGVPYGAKDLLAAAGAPTTWGVPGFADRVLDRDAAAIARLARGGAVLVAKLTTVGLGAAGRPSLAGASLHGSTRNPWDPDRYAGGSSSGPAAAVALGTVPFALGTETGGSIVTPAASCGVTGLRPTFGLVSRAGVMPVAPSLDKVGVLATSAEDCRAVLEAIIGRPLAARARRPLRIGVLDPDLREVAAHLREPLARALSDLEVSVGELVPVELDDARDGLQTIMLAEAAHAHRAALERDDFALVDPGQLARLRAGLELPAVDYLAARKTQRAVAADVRALLRAVDLLVAPAMPDTAQPLDEPRRHRGDRASDRLLTAANLAGLPGISLPAGLADDGLPVALHLAGPRRGDALVLAAAAAFQRATSHHLAGAAR